MPTGGTFATRLGTVVDVTDAAQVWLALAALSGRLPDDDAVTRARREATLDGPAALLRALDRLGTDHTVHVTTAVDAVLVDVQHTAATDAATGIQRVARETTRRWAAAHELTLVSWTDGFCALRGLTPREHARMRGAGPGPDEGAVEQARPTVIVPWRCRLLIPELAADPGRTSRLLALARYSCEVGAIGFDTVPITSATTSDSEFPGAFAGHLAALRHYRRLTTISRAAGAEYAGWADMLAAIGLAGPQIRPILLPAEVAPADDADLARARTRFGADLRPLVLVVGTFEPRKNHGSVLHAAELLWREGIDFGLVFVGGRSWKATAFYRRVDDLRAAGRAVEVAGDIDDALLFAAYRVAHCTVFPSLNEGFGLPAAESLAAGTPVITTAYGSTAEIAADGGAILVDPRDDHSVADAMRAVLTDPTLVERLRLEARSRPRRTWDDYARETWDYLTG